VRILTWNICYDSSKSSIVLEPKDIQKRVNIISDKILGLKPAPSEDCGDGK
jgi:hypothetical protein